MTKEIVIVKYGIFVLLVIYEKLLYLQTDAPLVTVLPTTVAAWEGETVELTCTADSNPSQTTVVWYRDDINVSDEADGTFVTYKKGNAYVLEINSILR